MTVVRPHAEVAVGIRIPSVKDFRDGAAHLPVRERPGRLFTFVTGVSVHDHVSRTHEATLVSGKG